MHILIAPNAFKNSLSALSAAKAIQSGLEQSKLAASFECFPIGDGGDGTAAALLQKRNGKVVPATVHDPLGRPITASYGLIEDQKTAIIELADASGLRLLNRQELSPLQASTFGTGELMRAALENGVNKIILCIGGSATVDGGTGILRALGFDFLDSNGKRLPLPAGLVQLNALYLSFDSRIRNCEIIVLCDVENPLVGENGAAAVFGPQKGATPAEVKQLDAGLKRLSEIVLQQTGIDMADIKHGGAAGGTAAGLSAFLNARLVNGIDYFLETTQFDTALQKADLVITGEGSLDRQTLEGKGPLGLAKRAKEAGVAVIGLAGNVALDEAGLYTYFDGLFSINSTLLSIEEAMKHTERNLVLTARQIGNLLAINPAVYTNV